MSWIQIILQADAEETEAIEQALLNLGALAITLSDNGDHPLFEPPPGELPLWDDTRIVGLFDKNCDLSEIESQLHKQWRILSSKPLTLRSEIVEDKDWESEWKHHFKPMHFGNRLWICPSWSEAPRPDQINLKLDPGLAFGTGTHPTTALCLQWLDHNNKTFTRVMDFGCGSGVLGIAAKLLGHKQIVAIDNDPQALLASAENARINQVSADINILSPAQLEILRQHQAQEVDLLMANILANPLIELAPLFADLTTRGGDLVLSGILSSQINGVKNAYENDFRDISVTERDDWCLIHAIKN